MKHAMTVALEMRRRWATEKYNPGEVADQLLERVGISEVANRKVDSLPTGTARLVELADRNAAASAWESIDGAGASPAISTTRNPANGPGIKPPQ